MEEEWKSRTELLIGIDNIQKLANSKVIVYGIGGVGSFVVEGLVRAGVENIILVDNDVIAPSNLNRQIHAIITNIGKLKVDCMKDRILSINPNVNIEKYIPQDIGRCSRHHYNKIKINPKSKGKTNSYYFLYGDRK